MLALALALAGCAGSGFARGAYAPEREPLRMELRESVERVVAVAAEEVRAIRAAVAQANAEDPQSGTGALTRVMLERVALEVAVGGSLRMEPLRGSEEAP
jgi:hypothetical protein